MSLTMTIEVSVPFQHVGRVSRKERRSDAESALPPGRAPRVARLMALALRFEELVRTGEVASYSELASLGHVTRARICQIMNLLHLAPDIQEALLFLPPTLRGRDATILADLQPIAAAFDWRKQRRLWRKLLPNGATESRPTGPPIAHVGPCRIGTAPPERAADQRAEAPTRGF